MSLPRYAEYKNSGVDWIGAMPAHWHAPRLKTLIQETDERASDLDTELLGLSKSRGVVKRSDLDQGAAESDDYSKYKLVHAGQLVMNKMQAWNGVFGLSRYFGKVSPDYAVFKILAVEQSEYLSLMVRTEVMAGIFFTRCRGMGTAFLRINTGDFLNIKVPMPPLAELQAISHFLDRETSKIDALIAEQERLIALLAEKRQATISHAVTRGLSPDAPMKDSGVAWLGEVPADWKVVPLKYLVELRSGGTPSRENPEYWNGDVPWASAKDLKVERLSTTADRITSIALETGAASLVPAGAILVVVRGMILARIFPVAETLVPMAINQDLKAVLPLDKVEGRFLAWLLRGTAEQSLLRLDEAGHGTKALRMEAWTSLEVPVPPLTEQVAIVKFLADETEKLSALGAHSERAITLLKERRSALITAAITGQIDVRGTVTIPVEHPEPIPA